MSRESEHFARVHRLFAELADVPPEDRRERAVELEDDGAVIEDTLELFARDARAAVRAAPRPDAAPLLVLLPGVRLGGRFTLEQPLSAGGSADVWVGVDGTNGTRVALKIAVHDAADALLRGEARALAACAGPGVVRVRAEFDAGGRRGLALDLVTGSALDAASLGAVARPALDVFRELVAVVAREIHARGWVHGDLKPANVRVSSEGAVTLVDFGCARSADEASASTGSAVQATTAQWCAPEVLAGAPATAAADVYALGLIAERAIAQALDASLRRALEPILGAALAPDPAQRPRDAGAFLAEIDRAHAEVVQRARRRRVGFVLAALTFVGGGVALAAWATRSRAQERAVAVQGTFDRWLADALDTGATTERLDPREAVEALGAARAAGLFVALARMRAADGDGPRTQSAVAAAEEILAAGAPRGNVVEARALAALLTDLGEFARARSVFFEPVAPAGGGLLAERIRRSLEAGASDPEAGVRAALAAAPFGRLARALAESAHFRERAGGMSEAQREVEYARVAEIATGALAAVGDDHPRGREPLLLLARVAFDASAPDCERAIDYAREARPSEDVEAAAILAASLIALERGHEARHLLSESRGGSTAPREERGALALLVLGAAYGDSGAERVERAVRELGGRASAVDPVGTVLARWLAAALERNELQPSDAPTLAHVADALERVDHSDHLRAVGALSRIEPGREFAAPEFDALLAIAVDATLRDLARNPSDPESLEFTVWLTQEIVRRRRFDFLEPIAGAVAGHRAPGVDRVRHVLEALAPLGASELAREDYAATVERLEASVGIHGPLPELARRIVLMTAAGAALQHGDGVAHPFWAFVSAQVDATGG